MHSRVLSATRRTGFCDRAELRRTRQRLIHRLFGAPAATRPLDARPLDIAQSEEKTLQLSIDLMSADYLLLLRAAADVREDEEVRDRSTGVDAGRGGHRAFRVVGRASGCGTSPPAPQSGGRPRSTLHPLPRAGKDCPRRRARRRRPWLRRAVVRGQAYSAMWPNSSASLFLSASGSDGWRIDAMFCSRCSMLAVPVSTVATAGWSAPYL